jgi:type I restriction enzyme S subunit
MNIMLAWNGSLGVSPIAGIASPAYCVFRARATVDPRFLHFLLRTPLFTGAFKTVSTGVVDSRLRLYPDVFFRLPSLLPPLPEQTAIVQFLDHADRRIRRYIPAKQKLIKLLEEQKQAIIHRAVTRGLDPNVRLEPSGVEWLGDVPEHWEVWQIGHFSQVGNGSTPSRGNSAYWSGGHYPWLNSACANQESVTQADQFVTDTALRECHLPIVPPASVLVAITGQGKTRGKAAVLRIEATINQHIAYITPREQIASADYLRLALHGAYAQLRSISDDSGSTKGALTCADIKHFRLALPSLSEQAAIFASVEVETRTCSAAIDRAQHEISLLREYRTRLIADVVTGKLDVRAAATSLPDEADEPEAIDDTDMLAEADEDATDGDLDAAPEEAEA